ncbi:AraC family transcriptional regulator [Streptomyces sp. AM8-1-1]|uniref:helix-turn-helix transcriptional regulator n=1 Tax=Streptomyces sp. AM8-1-1 TaxID=3075825 RepID=UPI0028C3C05E|nr:AraC family transcriptional regulator [Streptomyces sp. AM8-1-1]WNO70502.1 AraC family transcriptional regulator [Streptomyces sp. AM8-1-1]
MRGDPLSGVLDLIEIQGLMSSGFAVDGSWIAQGALDHPLKFVAVARGRARVTTDGCDGPVILDAGDVALLNHRSWLTVRGGPEDEPPVEIDVTRVGFTSLEEDGADVVLGGHIDLNPIGRELFTHTLPPMGLVRASVTDTPLRDRLVHLFDEAAGGRIGSSFAIRQHGQLLLLDMLRVYIHQAEIPPGWLRVLTDERLHPAVVLMHEDPGKPWRLETLAQAATMSRTSFATLFRTAAGMPPLAYLNRWRMLLAQRALRAGDDSIGAIGATLGYTSESAFSTAFKREVGESPLRYRSRVRSQAVAAGSDEPLTAQEP